MDKKALRTMMQKRRNALDECFREAASLRICNHITACHAWQKAEHVFLYFPFGSEINTKHLIERALESGKTVVLPVCQPERKLALGIYQKDTPLTTTSFGLLEIAPDAQIFLDPKELDFCLVPGLIFDRFGGRIGYGGGYYDRFLPTLPPNCFQLAGAFAAQVLDTPLPLEPFDIRMTYLCTENGIEQLSYANKNTEGLQK